MRIALLLLAAIAAACASSTDSEPARTAVEARLSCPLGRGDCDGDPGNGCESDLAHDEANCRACGHTCMGEHVGTAMCVDGRCAVTECELGFCAPPGPGDEGCPYRLCAHSHGIVCERECSEAAYGL